MAMTSAERSRRVQQARARFARDPFAECLGLTIGEVAPDRVPDRWDELLEPLDMRMLGRVDLM